MNSRPVVLYIACSIDGYIAGPEGELDFLSKVEMAGEDYGYAEFIKSVDTIIMVRKTYDKVLSFGIPFPHADKICYIVTRTDREPLDNINFYTGSLSQLIRELKSKPGNTIFVDGGAEVVAQLLEEDLIDEMVVSIIPSILGNGIRLFRTQKTGSDWQLISSREFESGLLQIRYVKV